MSHESEADYVLDYHNEEGHCVHCTSFSVIGGKAYCDEAKGEVEPNAHCDYFKSRD